MSDTQFFQELDHVEIRVPQMDLDTDAKKPAVRLFCTSAATSWLLQIRAHETLASGRQGLKFFIAGATLDRETMRALRDAINTQLEEYAEFRDPELSAVPE